MIIPRSNEHVICLAQDDSFVISSIAGCLGVPVRTVPRSFCLLVVYEQGVLASARIGDSVCGACGVCGGESGK